MPDERPAPPGVVAAAGGVLVRADGDNVSTVVIHRPRHDDWSFPKGKLDPGETFPAAALREVHEETAFRCRLGAPLGDVDYPQPDGTTKHTRYWIMTVVGDDGFVANDEVDAVRWVPLAEAPGVLSNPLDRALARHALAVLRPATPTIHAAPPS